jgi:hypothetical protein
MGARAAQALLRRSARLRQTRGIDGRRVFVFPTVLSSEDPQWQALDQITLKQWMEPERL